MQASNWIQLGLTLGTFIVGGILFYFKNLEIVRKEIRTSEDRLRGDLGSRIDGLVGEVHKLDVTVARLEERINVRRGSVSEPVPAE
jgi:hypothetical protein